MSEPPGWMNTSPEAAAILSGALAIVLRTATGTGQRRIRDVLIDACGTLPISYAAFHGAAAWGLPPGGALAIATFSGAIGWAVVQRLLISWVERNTSK